MSIVVVGSVAYDTITTPLGRAKEILGGSATYFSMSARFFSPIQLVAVVGRDFKAKDRSLLDRKGIDLAGLERKKGKTFRWKGAYGWDFADARTLSTCLNVFGDFQPRIPSAYRKSKCLFLANIDPQLQRKVLTQMPQAELIVADTMNYWIENKRRSLKTLLKKIDILLLNESEARMLTQATNVLRAARAIRKLGPRCVVIKRGEYGALLLTKDLVFSVPAYLLESVKDPTGAGDTFAGGFVGYLAKSGKVNALNLKRAVVYGSIMATFAVEDFSIRRLMKVRKSDIKKRYHLFKKQLHF